MKEQRRNGHTVTKLMFNLVWAKKYRDPVLNGDLQVRCREIIIQLCDTEDVQFLKGIVVENYCIKEMLLGKAFLGYRLRCMDFIRVTGFLPQQDHKF